MPLALLLLSSFAFSIPRAHFPQLEASVATPSAFTIKSWNCHALCMRERPKKMKKMKKLRSALANTDVMCLQELHGWQGEAEHTLFEQYADSEVFLSLGSDRNRAGCAIIVKKTILRHTDCCSHLELIPGRAHAVSFWSEDAERSSTIVNVHNYDLSDRDLGRCEGSSASGPAGPPSSLSSTTSGSSAT